MTYRHSDCLRGLLDRDSFIRLLSALGQHGDTAAALIVEIDQPSRVNYRLGDGTGDALMRLVLGRTREVLPIECLAARVRENAIALVLFTPATQDAVDKLCDDLHTAIRTPITGTGSQIYVSASIGVAFTAPRSSVVATMQHAERALERVLSNGGDATFVYRPSQPINVEIAA